MRPYIRLVVAMVCFALVGSGYGEPIQGGRDTG